MARDIDDWVYYFGRKAGPRLDRLFGVDAKQVPDQLTTLLDELRSTEVVPKAHDDGSEPQEK